MDVLWSTLSFFVVIGVLVSFHEYGHFWCARRCGVHVERFSIGFGRVIWSKIDKHGTEFAISLIPLGGYVAMRGEATPAADALQLRALARDPRAFDSKHPWAKIAITLAGPVANFILAIVLYWAVFLIGHQSIMPITGTPAEGSIAQKAGLEAEYKITHVGDTAVLDWQDISLAMSSYIGDAGPLPLRVQKADGSSFSKQINLDIQNWHINESEPDLLGSLGIALWFPKVTTVIGSVSPQGEAERAGLRLGDKILAIDGVTVDDWQAVSAAISPQKNKVLQIEIQRDNQILQLMVKTKTIVHQGKEIAIIGITPVPVPFPDIYRQTIQYNLGAALVEAVNKTVELTVLSADMLGKLVTGQLSVKSLSGPLSIAQGAGQTAQHGGLIPFLIFMALISVNLGFINLLPIPMLDGGSIVVHTVELIRKRPLSQQTQVVLQRIGLIIVGVLMAIAIFNDASRIGG